MVGYNIMAAYKNEDNDICILRKLEKGILINNNWGYPTVGDA